MKYIAVSVTLLIALSTFFYVNTKEKSSYSDFLKTNYQNFSSFDNPSQAGFRDFIMTVDPELKRVPLERLYTAILETKNQVNLKSTSSINWLSVPSNTGGRSKTLMYSGSKLWAGTATGGLWYNNDVSGSGTWSTISDSWPSLAISSICEDPTNTNTIYVGTGEWETAIHIYRESSGIGRGIWKTTDAGSTWQPLPTSFDFAYITDIITKDEAGTGVIYAGAMSGEYQDSTFQSTPTDGLYRSVDGGTTWTQVLPNIPGESVPFSVSDIELAGNGKIYVGTSANLNGNGAGYILTSTTGLSGSWTIIDQFKTEIEADTEYFIPGRVKLASSASNSSVVYAAFAAKSNTQLVAQFPQTIGKYIVKTTNAGTSWSHINIPADENGKNWAYLAWHAFAISVDPNNENNIFIGGLDVHKSTNGGNTWHKISDWVLMYYGGGSNFIHGDIHSIVFYNGSSDSMVVATDGGIFYTSDATNLDPVFFPKNNDFNTLQFYTCAISPQNGTEYYSGGLQDNGTFYHTNHPLNIDDMISGGDGANTFFDKNENNILISSTYNNQYTIYTDITSFNGYYENGYSSGTFVSPADYDWQDNTIYANAGDITGARLNEILKLELQASSANGTFINANTTSSLPYSFVRIYKTTLGDPILYIGTPDGTVYKTENINSSPISTQIDNGQLPNGYISCIQTGNTDDTLLVTFSNYGVESIWQSYNNGGNWTNISGVNLPDMPIRYALYHPQNSKQIMLATETGIWTTEDASANYVVWNAQNAGLANVRIDMIQVRESDNIVLAGTHGRGMYTTVWDYFATSVKENNIVDLKIYPNPASSYVQVESGKLKAESCSVLDIYGRTIQEFNIQSSEFKIRIEDLPNGTYFIKLETDKGTVVEKFVKN